MSKAQFRFIYITAAVLFILSFAPAVTLHAQSNCLRQTYSFHTDDYYYYMHPGVIPFFQTSSGTLVGFETSVSGYCSTTGGIENHTNTSGTVQLSMVCSASATLGPYYESLGSWGPTASASVASLTMWSPVVPLGPYDGVNDLAGTSGTLQSLGPNYFQDTRYYPTTSLMTTMYTGSGTSPIPIRLQTRAFPLNQWQRIGFNGTGIGVNQSSPIHSASIDVSFSYIYTTAGSPGLDCNVDGISDSCDLIIHDAPDSNNNGVPDYCESLPDCDNDGITDANEISLGAPDLNSNGIPDSCEVPLADCDQDGISDDDEIAAGALDCNANDLPDFCEIASSPSLDSGVEFGSDGVLNLCQGRVQWEKPTSAIHGIVGARLKAYWISGSDTSPVFHDIPEDPTSSSYLSNATGRFIVPKEYFSYAHQSGELGRGIKASVIYVEDTGITTGRSVTNYPGWDPLRPIRFGSPGGGVSERRIIFPSPVVFQAGVLAQINSDAVNTLRPFLLLDAGSSGAEAAIKRGSVSPGSSIYTRQPIPAFLFFAIPSGGSGSYPGSNDGVSWGYNNNPMTANAAIVSSNAAVFQNFLTNRVKPQLDVMTVGSNSSAVPLNIAAHSYGGVITRKWITLSSSYPQMNKYVSFDGVHGGTEPASLGSNSFFQERNMNGTAPTLNGAPTVQGWNYSHVVSTGLSKLLFSNAESSVFDAISPYTSAFGIGRTIYSPFYETSPNGHCRRFVGGWELPTFLGTHSIQNRLPAVVSAARFMAYGAAPYLGTEADAGAYTTVAEQSASADDPMYSSAGCNVSYLLAPPPPAPSGKLSLQMNVASGGQTDTSLPIDSLGLLKVSAYISSADASLEVYDGVIQLPKLNVTTEILNSTDYITSFDIDVPSTGVKTLRMSTSSSDAEAIVNITFPGTRYGVAFTGAEEYDPGSSVNVRAQVRIPSTLPSGLIINPTVATVVAQIRDPNGAVTNIPLYDDGTHGDSAADDGTYGNWFTSTSVSGFYSVHTDSDYNWVGLLLRRSADTSFQVRSNAASLLSVPTQHGQDNDADGLLDGWAIDLPVLVNLSGEYRISADLVGPSGSISTIDRSFSANAGANITESLLIPIETLSAIDPNGAYSLSNIRLIEPLQGLTLSELATIPLTLPSLSQLEQLPPPAVSQILPNFGPARGNFDVIIHGSGFATTRAVKIGGKNAAFRIISDDTLEVTIPRHRLRAVAVPYPQPSPGPTQIPLPPVIVGVRVITSSGVGEVDDGFTYIPR